MPAAPGQRAAQAHLSAAAASQRAIGAAVSQDNPTASGPVGYALLNGAYYVVDLRGDAAQFVPTPPPPALPPEADEEDPMSTPLTADRLVQALRDEGVTVVETPGWRTHNRNSRGPWGPVHGVAIHHTVTRGTSQTVAIVRDGYEGLPGPLCHGMIAKSGTVYMIGNGRTNHAGLGDPDVLNAVIAERELPPDNEATVDGNRHFYGFECENAGDGVDPWPGAQLEAIERASAAICRAHGWGARSVIGHLEWQPGKPDPKGFQMSWMREQIAKRLGGTKPGPLPAPQPIVVELAPLASAARTNPGMRGTPVTYREVTVVEAALVDEGLLAKPYLDGHFGTATVEAYAAWQRRCGYSGDDANGIPGRDSLTRLGARHGFEVH